MASTTFVDGATVIVAGWLNDVNNTTYNVVPPLVTKVTQNTTDITNRVTKTSGTGSAVIPKGTSGQRDGTPVKGYFRYNETLDQFEGYGASGWGKVGGGATGGGVDAVFVETDKVVTANYTITTGKNAMTAGPVTIANGVTVTVPDGSVWTIV